MYYQCTTQWKSSTSIIFSARKYLTYARVKREWKSGGDQMLWISYHQTIKWIAREFPVDEKPYDKDESEDRDREPQKFPKTVADGPEYGNAPSSIQNKNGWRSRTRAHSELSRPNCKRIQTLWSFRCRGWFVLRTNDQFYHFQRKVKSNGVDSATVTLGTLWNPATPNNGDPIVLYDPAAVAGCWHSLEVPETNVHRDFNKHPTLGAYYAFTHLHHPYFWLSEIFGMGWFLFYDFESGAKICIWSCSHAFRWSHHVLSTQVSVRLKAQDFSVHSREMLQMAYFLPEHRVRFFLTPTMAGAEVLQMQSPDLPDVGQLVPSHTYRDHYSGRKYSNSFLRCIVWCELNDGPNPAPLKNWMESACVCSVHSGNPGDHTILLSELGVKSVPHKKYQMVRTPAKYEYRVWSLYQEEFILGCSYTMDGKYRDG